MEVKAMVHLNRIFFALCLLCTSNAFSITAELLNRLKRELAEVETVLAHSKDLSEKLKMAKLGRNIIKQLSEKISDPCSSPKVFKNISFQGLSLVGGTEEKVESDLTSIDKKLESIEKSLEAKQRALDKAEKAELLAEIDKLRKQLKRG